MIGKSLVLLKTMYISKNLIMLPLSSITFGLGTFIVDYTVDT